MITNRPKVYTSYMTMLVGVSTKDRIVLLADGKSTDTDTEEIRLDVKKIHEVAPNIVLCISGMYLDDPEKMLKTIKWDLMRNNATTLPEVQKYLTDYTHSFIWADMQNESKAKLHLLLVGYYLDTPHILRISSTKDEVENCSATVSEVWKNTQKELIRGLVHGKKFEYSKTNYDKAEKVAETLMEKGYKIKPDEVGGKSVLCHVFPHTINWKEPTSAIIK